MNKEKIKCPLCGADAEYREQKKDYTYTGGTVTHLWVCDDCPFVGFEYYDATDAEAIKEALD